MVPIKRQFGRVDNRGKRLAVAVAIGLATGIFAYVHAIAVEPPQHLGLDFTWPWRAARALLAHQNPYDVIRATGPYPFDATFKYPLPAALLALPLAWMPAALAMAVFGAISGGLLAWGLSAKNFDRLWLLASAPYVINTAGGQWSALLMASTLIPSLGWLAVTKPTVGGAAFMYRPSRVAFVGGLAFLAVSFIVLPSWFADWVRVIRTTLEPHYIMPVALMGGPFLLLAALRWRRPEARWLVVLSLAPQALTFYTALLPMLVAETKREAQFLAVSSTLAWLGWEVLLGGQQPGSPPVLAGYWLLWGVFFPALLMVLRRPNEAPTPIPQHSLSRLSTSHISAPRRSTAR